MIAYSLGQIPGPCTVVHAVISLVTASARDMYPNERYTRRVDRCSDRVTVNICLMYLKEGICILFHHNI